ncbi:hypothetical protein VTK26DRAFT_8436 [Humicola hyalothermophila]
MAVVLTTEEDGYFSSTLRRSSSQTRLGSKHSGLRTSASTSCLSDLCGQSSHTAPDSTKTLTSPSPRTTQGGFADSSCLVPYSDDGEQMSPPTPENKIPSRDDDDDAGYFSRRGITEPSPSPQTDETDTTSPTEENDSAVVTRPGSPDLNERAEDDIAIRAQPSRHVDYLSHNWREEDIWSSWKHIVARRGDYSNAARLENASWRTWMKAKNNLSTVSPETLNWLKDCDVTWLYGPLQTGSASLDQTSASSNSARISKSNSFINKKPILKKRSMSEIMLQRSLSTSSLVKQAAAAVQAQQKDGLKRAGRRPGLERATTDYVTFPFSSRGFSHDGTSLFPSTRSSGIVSPSGERKHIHFNERVAQCIAVDVKGDDDDDDADSDRYPYDSDSDDGAIMMKRTQPKKRRPILKKAKAGGANAESKTIAMLPSTTLKYEDEEEDGPDAEFALKHSPSVLRSPVLSPSSSQETLRPSKKSGKLFIPGDQDSENEEEESDDDDPSTTRRFAGLRYSDSGSGLRRSASSTTLSGRPGGMRRTESGMLMPSHNGMPNTPSDGVLGRIIETTEAAFNTTHRLPHEPTEFSRDVR